MFDITVMISIFNISPDDLLGKIDLKVREAQPRIRLKALLWKKACAVLKNFRV